MFFIIFSSPARLASAFASPRMPSTALKTVSTTNTIVVPHSRVNTRLNTAAPSRIICMKSWYWRRKACQPDSFFLPVNSLRPYFCSRCCASAELNPLAGSTSSTSETAPAVMAYQFIWSCSASVTGFPSLLERFWNPAERIVRFHIVSLGLSPRELHRFARHFFIRHLTEQVGDKIQTRPALVVGIHDVPGAFGRIRGGEHGIARRE